MNYVPVRFQVIDKKDGGLSIPQGDGLVKLKSYSKFQTMY